MEQEQCVTFHRNSHLDGVELRRARSSREQWHAYSTGYDFVVPTSWAGMIWHRGTEMPLEPGFVLCASPRHVYSSRRAQVGGGLLTLTIDADVFEPVATRAGYQPEVPKTPVRMSPQLAGHFAVLARFLQTGAEPTCPKAVLAEFVQLTLSAAAPELGDEPAPSTARYFECVPRSLEEDGCGGIDLATLAELTGLSRFQALRAFKRRYGLPPHTYQLRVRLGMAQKALRQGEPPARVAAATGFVDQSHLARHFKRALGVTPGQYARVGLA